MPFYSWADERRGLLWRQIGVNDQQSFKCFCIKDGSIKGWHWRALAWVKTSFCGPEGSSSSQIWGLVQRQPWEYAPSAHRLCNLSPLKTQGFQVKVFTFYWSLPFIFLCSKPFQQHKHFIRQLHQCGCCMFLTEYTFSMLCHFCLTKQVNKLYSYELWLHHVQTALSERLCCPRY